MKEKQAMKTQMRAMVLWLIPPLRVLPWDGGGEGEGEDMGLSGERHLRFCFAVMFTRMRRRQKGINRHSGGRAQTLGLDWTGPGPLSNGISRDERCDRTNRLCSLLPLPLPPWPTLASLLFCFLFPSFLPNHLFLYRVFQRHLCRPGSPLLR